MNESHQAASIVAAAAVRLESCIQVEKLNYDLSPSSSSSPSPALRGAENHVRQEADYTGGAPGGWCCSFCHYRFLVVILVGFVGGMMAILRYNITVAIINMVNQTALYLNEHPNSTLDDYLAQGYPSDVGEFVWTNEIQQMIMSWYMIAYTLPQIPATKLALMVGSRWAIFVALSVCALSSLMLPAAAHFGWQWALCVRLINGIGGSPILAMQLSLLESWLLPDEISLGLTLSKFSTAIITASGPLFVGHLCKIHWSYAFYVPALIGQLLAIAWFILTTDRPEDNWLISKRELDLLQAARAKRETSSHKTIINGVGGEPTQREASILDILGEPSFYAYVLVWFIFCNSLGDFILIMPTYLRQFLRLEVTEAGLYTTIIQTGFILAVLWPHPVLRLIRAHWPHLSATGAQRTVYGSACVLTALCWMYTGLMHQHQVPVFLLSQVSHNSGSVLVVASLMSNYAQAGLSSMAFSIINTIGNLSVVFTSTFIGWLLDETAQSRECWSWILLALGASQLAESFTFIVFIRNGPIEFKRRRDDARKPIEIRINGQPVAAPTTNESADDQAQHPSPAAWYDKSYR